jgi:hypothetical protein
MYFVETLIGYDSCDLERNGFEDVLVIDGLDWILNERKARQKDNESCVIELHFIIIIY